MSKHQTKRVDIVSIKMIKEKSVLYKGRKISNPGDVIGLVKDFTEESDREKFIAIYLNTKNEPAAIHTVSVGSLNASLVHPREVFKGALTSNASGLICVHNHPSGDPTPSKEDVTITKRLQDAGEILGIRVLDHLIIGDDERFFSFKEEGKM